MHELINWKNTKDKECLIIKGARQIGKTYIVNEFARDNYRNYIYINFIEQPNLKSIFEGELSANEIYKKISLLIPNIEFISGETLIFLDEIQECPDSRTALKFLAIDNSYDVIASGSLLGIRYKEVSSIPVGYERQIIMHSLDFEEYLWSIGVSHQAISIMQESFDNLSIVDSAVNEKFTLYFRDYIVIGGMPAVVSKFVETNNYQKAYDEQMKIINSYSDDISKYALTKYKPKIKNCYLSIPKQLARENKKFMYSVVEKGATARKYANSIDWLRDANLVTYCRNVETPTFPLSAYEKLEQYKIYINDIGLLVAMYGFEMKEAIIQNTLKGNAKGGIYENAIADILIKKGYALYYYKNDNNRQEIEFLMSKNSQIVPIEVKAGNSSTLSLNNLLNHEDIKYGYKFILGNVGQIDKKITLPHYMVMFL